MSPLTVPEVQRLLLAAHQSARERRFHRWWSTFRRQHQALARRCHVRSHEQTQRMMLTGTGVVTIPSVTRQVDDALWERIATILPQPRRRGEQPPLPYRTILDGILWAARTGTPWRDLPARFGPWKTVHATYYRWQQLGYWPAVLAILQTDGPPVS